MHKIHTFLLFAGTVSLFSGLAFSQSGSTRYALILQDNAVSQRYQSREQQKSAEAGAYRRQIRARQQSLLRELDSRKAPVTGATDTLINAIFVAIPPDRVGELRNLPGVAAVIPLRRYRHELNRATQL